MTVEQLKAMIERWGYEVTAYPHDSDPPCRVKESGQNSAEHRHVAKLYDVVRYLVVKVPGYIVSIASNRDCKHELDPQLCRPRL